MSLTNRIAPLKPESDPEDFLSSALSVVFPDTVANQHGDADNDLIYSSPALPKPLRIELADPLKEDERVLFGHYLWNASLLAAEMIEVGTLGFDSSSRSGSNGNGAASGEYKESIESILRGSKTMRELPQDTFDVRGKSIIELGAGTALPSTMAGLLGAGEVCVTDYPAPTLISMLKANVKRNLSKENVPSGSHMTESVIVEGHKWGDLEEGFAEERKGAFDVVIAADCLWMTFQHTPLRDSIAHFLKPRHANPQARAWVVAAFHTGREKMCGFFGKEFLADAGLEVEALWEVDCAGKERPWAEVREGEDFETRRRWLAVGILKRMVR